MDVVPLTLCQNAMNINLTQSEGPQGDCTDPHIHAELLADGGALDNILREAATAGGGGVADYYNAQGVTRGLGVVGLRFQHRYSVGWSNQDLDPPNVNVTEIRIASAICKLEMGSLSAGTRVPIAIPNLWARDERALTGKILHRWHDALWLMFTPPGNAFNDIAFVDTDGGSSVTLTPPTLGGGPSQWAIRSPTSSLRHHTVRNRRFLDEDHGLFLVTAVIGIGPGIYSSDLTLGIELYGELKLRGR